MYAIKDRIAEMTVTEWRGVRVRVSLEIPSMENTMTTQMLLDARDLQYLKYFKPPKGLEKMSKEKQRKTLDKWSVYRSQAQKVIDMIAGRIAIDLIHAAIGEK
jgi:hypothetical protein